MEFFKELNTLLNQATLNITITKKEGNLTVSVTPIAPEGVKLELKPLIFNGTPDELDAKFIETLRSPLLKTEVAFSNADQYMTELEAKKSKKTEKADKGEKEEKETPAKKGSKKDDVLMGKGLKKEPELFEQTTTPAPVINSEDTNMATQTNPEPEPIVEKVVEPVQIPAPEVKAETPAPATEEKKDDLTLDLF